MKKHLLYPLSLADLSQFCHPTREEYRRPFLVGDDTAVSNGFLCFILENATECDHTQPEAEARTLRLPWELWDSWLDDTEGKKWGLVDERRGGLWQHGHKPLFPVIPENGPARACQLERVSIGHPRNIISVPVLQLISSLPRAEVYLDPFRKGLLPFRFNRGKGFAAMIDPDTLDTLPSYHLWKKTPDLFSY